MVVLLFVTIDFLSTVLASMVVVVYFLVRPEMKNYYITSGNEKENNVSLVLKTLRPEERSIVGVFDGHGGKVHHERNRPITVEDAPDRRGIVRAGHRKCREIWKYEPGLTRKMVPRRDAQPTTDIGFHV